VSSYKSFGPKVKNSLQEFESKFSRLKHKNLVLYGLGPLTKKIIDHALGYKIVGLMHNNENFIGSYFYNKKILSVNQIKKIKPVIIIATNKKNTAAQIFEEIKYLKKNNISIYLSNGKIAKSEEHNVHEFQKKISEFNIEKIKEKILKHDIISFDLYDTLITRKIINPHEVFDLIEKKINSKFSRNIKYAVKRIECENECFIEHSHNFNIDDIYKKLGKKLKVNKNILSFIKKTELDTEYKITQPRKKIIDLYNFSIKKGKNVNIISDMYLDNQSVKKILKKNKIKNYKNLLISGEIKKNKLDGTMFSYFKNIQKGKKYLHIGDDYNSDIVKAKQNKINSIKVLSIRELSSHFAFLNHLNNIKKNIADKIVFGLILNKIFISYPEHIKKNRFTPTINKFEDVGYVFYGPLILYYLIWLIQESTKLKIKKILFCAREGYFIKKLYIFLCKKIELKKFPEPVYFKTSRRMAVIPSLMNFSDIIKTFKNHRYFGTIYFLLKNRLGLKKLKKNKGIKKIINSLENFQSLKKILNKYKNEIIKNAREERKNYKIYLNKIVGRKRNKIALSDQGFFGSVQDSLQKILNIKFYGLYLSSAIGQNNKRSFKKGFYNYPDSNFQKFNHISETFLTAPEGAYLYFDGKKFFNDKKFKNQNNFKLKKLMFNGVQMFFKDFIKIDKDVLDTNLNNEFSDEVFGMIPKEIFKIDKKILKTFYFDNSYVREKAENKIII